MNREPTNTRPVFLWPLIAFAAGLLIGWLGIGWGVWPVSYKNALPMDLRPTERNAYLSMVAESYAGSGDLDTARERLATWSADELATTLGSLQDDLSTTNAKAAGDVQLLGTALGLGALSAEAPAAVSPQATPATAAGGATLLKTICTTVLWVVLILAGIAGLIYLFNLWRVARNRQPSPAITPEILQPAERTSSEIAAAAKRRWLPENEDVGIEEPEPIPATVRPASAERTVRQVEDLTEEPLPSFLGQRESVRPAGASIARPTTPAAEPVRRTPVAQPTSLTKLGDFVAIYQMGEPDYDEAFDINDPIDGYVGQCGLQLSDPIGSDRDQAAALQAWLWDTSDPDTRLTVLMSEGAYRDTALRAQQAGEHTVIAVRPGVEFEIETHDLLLRGRVEKLEYTDQEPARSIFSELQLRLQAYRKS